MTTKMDIMFRFFCFQLEVHPFSLRIHTYISSKVKTPEGTMIPVKSPSCYKNKRIVYFSFQAHRFSSVSFFFFFRWMETIDCFSLDWAMLTWRLTDRMPFVPQLGKLRFLVPRYNQRLKIVESCQTTRLVVGRILWKLQCCSLNEFLLHSSYSRVQVLLTVGNILCTSANYWEMHTAMLQDFSFL